MKKWTPSRAMTAALQSLPEGMVGSNIYEPLLKAAGQLSSAAEAITILGVLGDRQFYGLPAPPVVGPPPEFPPDHLYHLDLGNEWYWLSANLLAADGKTQIGLLIDVHRWRLLSQDIQAQAGWSDLETQALNSLVTVVVNDGATSRIICRSPNTQWLHDGGEIVFPTPENFVIKCGPDMLTGGSENVLPLRAQIADGERLILDVTFSTALPESQQPWFLQGDNGRTPYPRAGIYYSWPQLSVSGTITVDGHVYHVTGKGWVDHQLMMGEAIAPPSPRPPILPHPVTEHSTAYDGWNFCQFNFDNGDAFAGAIFQIGAYSVNPLSYYGYYVRPAPGGWAAEYVEGQWSLDQFIPTLHNVLQPTTWTYRVTSATKPADVDVVIQTTPLHLDGSFVIGDQTWASEVPVTVSLTNAGAPPGSGVGGAGYCETVGAEIPFVYQERAIAWLLGRSGGGSGN